MTPIRRILVTLWACVVLALCALPTTAAEVDPQQLFDAAQKAFDAQEYEAALPLFRKAYHATDSPNARLYMARCLRELGRLAEAYDEMHATTREATAKAESEERYVPTRDSAAAELALLEPRVAKLVLTLQGKVEGATVTLDGQPVAAERLEGPITVEPGAHRIVVRAPGRADASQEVSVEGGQTRALALAAGALPDPGSKPAPVGRDKPKAEETGGGVRIAGIVVTTVGVGGIVVFALTHVMADDKLATLEEECGSERCTDPKYADTVDSGKTLETVANVSVIAGSALIVGGVAMIVFGGPSEPEEQEATALLSVSPAGAFAGIRGRF